MTAKRFIFGQNGNFHTVIDTVENKPMGVFEFKENEFPVYACFHMIIDKINELYEENQLLHKTIEELDNCQKGQSHRINDLYLENKQLKDLITHLGYTIKYDGYRHISLELKR